MNEEFGVLKDMIPACEGVEMHKLAILQAGIEYLRYLEGCVSQLKAENARMGGNLRLEGPSRVQIERIQDEGEDSGGEDDVDENEQDEPDEDDDNGPEPEVLLPSCEVTGTTRRPGMNGLFGTLASHQWHR